MKTIERNILKNSSAGLPELKHAYSQTLRLQSQILSLIYDREVYGFLDGHDCFSEEMSRGENGGTAVTLTIYEPLPSMKRLTEAIEEHWKAMIHEAIREAARQDQLPHFEKAFVQIEIVTVRGSNNAKLWDTSNRAINVIINNLKGIFFEDDNMEHMAFSVVGKWGEKGCTTIRILEMNETKMDQISYQKRVSP